MIVHMQRYNQQKRREIDFNKSIVNNRAEDFIIGTTETPKTMK